MSVCWTPPPTAPGLQAKLEGYPVRPGGQPARFEGQPTQTDGDLLNGADDLPLQENIVAGQGNRRPFDALGGLVNRVIQFSDVFLSK